jgi:hypothetical protein
MEGFLADSGRTTLRMNVFSRLLRERETPTPSALEIAAQIQQLFPHVHSGTLCYWGVWFGKPYDNYHRIVRAEADGDCLTLHFNEEETLRVWHPCGCEIDERQFIIWSASRVLWQWYWYGRPHTPDHLMSEEFVREGEIISFQSTFPYQDAKTPSVHEPAVQIH